MNNKHLSWYEEINNNFIIASRAYFLQSPTCTRVKNLDYIVMILTPMEFWCWSCFSCGSVLVNMSATFTSICILQISMSPSNTWWRMELKRLLMCLVLLWNLDSFAKATAPVLSQEIFIGPNALGMTLIRLQRIYNFWLFHAIILPVLDVDGLYFTHLYHFWD